MFVRLNAVLAFLCLCMSRVVILDCLNTGRLTRCFLVIRVTDLIAFVPVGLKGIFRSAFTSLLQYGKGSRGTRLAGRCRGITGCALLLAFSVTLAFVLFGGRILKLFTGGVTLGG